MGPNALPSITTINTEEGQPRKQKDIPSRLYFILLLFVCLFLKWKHRIYVNKTNLASWSFLQSPRLVCWDESPHSGSENQTQSLQARRMLYRLSCTHSLFISMHVRLWRPRASDLASPSGALGIIVMPQIKQLQELRGSLCLHFIPEVWYRLMGN